MSEHLLEIKNLKKTFPAAKWRMVREKRAYVRSG